MQLMKVGKPPGPFQNIHPSIHPRTAPVHKYFLLKNDSQGNSSRPLSHHTQGTREAPAAQETCRGLDWEKSCLKKCGGKCENLWNHLRWQKKPGRCGEDAPGSVRQHRSPTHWLSWSPKLGRPEYFLPQKFLDLTVWYHLENLKIWTKIGKKNQKSNTLLGRLCKHSWRIFRKTCWWADLVDMIDRLVL